MNIHSTKTTATNDNDTPSVDEAPKKKRRRRAVRGSIITHPSVRRGQIDGEPVVFIGLSGKGFRREMIVDADRWPMVVERWGASWVLMTDGARSHAYVASGRSAVNPLAAQDGPHPTALLARLLMNATADQVIRFENGDSLDLRDANLKGLSREEALRWAPGMGAFLASFGVAA